MDKLNKTSKRILIAILSIIFTLVLLFAVDKLLGLVIKEEKPADVFYLPPNSHVIYNTAEFSIKVETNSLGFRGRDYSQDKPPNTTRLMALGDSYTYGWGVNLEDTWTDILEKSLNSNYPDQNFEVLNFGKSGLDPSGYLEMVKQYLPIYKPDYLLIGILEGDDFGQLYPWPQKEKIITSQTQKKREKVLEELKSMNNQSSILSSMPNTYTFLYTLYPNILSYVSKYKTLDTRPTLLTQMERYLSNMDEKELNRLSLVTPFFKEKFFKGDLNPVLLAYAVSVPDHFIKILDTDDSIVQQTENKLTGIIKEIDKIAKQHGAKTIIIDMPYSIFVSQKYAKISKDMGFSYVENSWLSDIPVETLQTSAKEAEVDFFPYLNRFRISCSDCFYDYDGHMKPSGHHFLAEVIIHDLKQFLDNQ